MEAQAYYKLEIFREFLASQGGRIDVDFVRIDDDLNTETGVASPSTFFGELITLNEKRRVQVIGYESIGTPETINKVTLYKKSNVRTYLVETDSQLDGLLTHSEELKSVIDKEIYARIYAVLRGVIDANKDNSSDISIELGRGFTVCEEAVILGDESYNWPVSTLMDIHVPDPQKEVIEATFSDGGIGVLSGRSNQEVSIERIAWSLLLMKPNCFIFSMRISRELTSRIPSYHECLVAVNG